MDLRTETGIARIKLLRDAIYTDSKVGRLLILSLKATQLEAGIKTPILEFPDIPVPYITPTWITSLRTFLALHNIQISITDRLSIRYSNHCDECIMNLENLKGYTTSQQRDINWVRLHLRVITLSDMSQPGGTDILPSMLKGDRESTSETDQHSKRWPRQPKPSATQRRLWTRYIQAHYLRYGTKWRRPLGAIVPPQTRAESPPAHRIRKRGPTTQQHPSKFIQRLPKWHQRLLRNHRQLASDLQVWRAFRSRRRLTIASDGGLKDRLATFGWKIISRGKGKAADTPLFEGSGPVDGPYDINTSTRSELGGLVAPLLLCVSLAAHWGLRHKCKLGWLTDSKAAISRVEFITRKSNRISKAPEDNDYMTAIRELSKSLGRKITTQWIKGHQDEITPYEKLSRAAKLNVDVDNLATAHQEGTINLPRESIPHLREQLITIAVNGYRYPSQVDAQIRYHINGSNLKQYLTRKQGWTEETWQKIDLHNFGTHFRRLSTSLKVQHMKYVYDLQSTGQRKGKISNTTSGQVTLCPCCCKVAETQFHLLHCTHNPVRAKSLQEFYTEVRRSTGDIFGRIISEFFEQWFDDPHSNPSIDNTQDPTLDYTIYSSTYIECAKTALNHQREIGWMNATRGFLAKTWYNVACSQLQIPSSTGEVIHTHREDGHQRTYQLVRAIHTLVTSIWKGRNDELHRNDREHESVQRTAIDAEIARLHSAPGDLPAADQHYCNHTLEHILRKPPTYKRRWLHRVRFALAQRNQEESRQRRTTNFFHRAPHKRNDQGSTAHTVDPPTVTRPHNTRKPPQTTQRILTEFFRERAPNTLSTTTFQTPPSPSP